MSGSKGAAVILAAAAPDCMGEARRQNASASCGDGISQLALNPLRLAFVKIAFAPKRSICMIFLDEAFPFVR